MVAEIGLRWQDDGQPEVFKVSIMYRCPKRRTEVVCRASKIRVVEDVPSRLRHRCVSLSELCPVLENAAATTVLPDVGRHEAWNRVWRKQET